MKKANLLTLLAVGSIVADAPCAMAQSVETIDNKVYSVGYTMPPATFYSRTIDEKDYTLGKDVYVQLAPFAPNVFTNASVVMNLSDRSISPWGSDIDNVNWYIVMGNYNHLLGKGETTELWGEPSLFGGVESYLPTLEISNLSYYAGVNGYYGGRYIEHETGVNYTSTLVNPKNVLLSVENSENKTVPAQFNNILAAETLGSWVASYPEYENGIIKGAANVIGAPAKSYVLRSVRAIVKATWKTAENTPVYLTAKVYAYNEEDGTLGKVLATAPMVLNYDQEKKSYTNSGENEPVGISTADNLAPTTITQAVAVAIEVPENSPVTSLTFDTDLYKYEPEQGADGQPGDATKIVRNDLIPDHAAVIATSFDAAGTESTVIMRATKEMAVENKAIGSVAMMFGTEQPYLYAQYDWNAEKELTYDEEGAPVNVGINAEVPSNDFRIACPVMQDQVKTAISVKMADGSDMPAWLTVTLSNPDDTEIADLRNELDLTGEPRFFNAQFTLSKNAPADAKADVVISYLGCSQTFAVNTSTSGIEGIEADSNAAAKGIYDLQGRRLENADAPGFYIIDGKKVVVK